MFFPPRNIVEKVKKEYPSGTRIELVSMNDPYRDIPTGTRGPLIVWMIQARFMWHGIMDAISELSMARTHAESCIP